MARHKETIRITSPQGLHARPASLFVQLANQFRCKIAVRKGDDVVDGKSIMGLLMLALEQGSTVEVETDGPDAEAASTALTAFLTRPDG